MYVLVINFDICNELYKVEGRNKFYFNLNFELL